MTLLIQTPDTRAAERGYILDVLLGEFLGLAWHHEPSARADVRITLADWPGEIRLPDALLSVPDQDWLTLSTMPKQPLPLWDADELSPNITLAGANVPLLYGDTYPHVRRESDRINLPIDIFGSAFFMLSRYEEVVIEDSDCHDRFQATASVAFLGGFLDRPVVDEYIEILRRALNQLWPGLVCEPRSGGVRVTCDVDQPFDCRVRDFRRWLGRMGGDVLGRRNLGMAYNRFRNRFAVRRGDFRFDPYHTFEWYLDACEQAGRRAAFYFIPGHSSSVYDSCYDLDEPVIKDLIRRVAYRGHEVGVHGSYNTFRDSDRIDRERQRMIETCRKVGIHDPIGGNRQHYLRWDARETPDHLDAAGYEYDTSGGFADRPGFRYGTARPFPMWSWQNNAPLQIMQRPLVLMERSVLDERYMGIGNSREAMDLMLTLKRRSMAFGGDFMMLWHNSWLTTAEDRALFMGLID